MQQRWGNGMEPRGGRTRVGSARGRLQLGAQAAQRVRRRGRRRLARRERQAHALCGQPHRLLVAVKVVDLCARLSAACCSGAPGDSQETNRMRLQLGLGLSAGTVQEATA